MDQRALLGAAVVSVALTFLSAGSAAAIQGGEPATREWVAQITVDTSPIGGGWRGNTCTGALITPKFVLTAAHCIGSHRRSDWKVTFNFGADPEHSYKVDRIIPHSGKGGEDSQGNAQDDDLALIELDRPASEPTVNLDSESGTVDQLNADHATVTEYGYGEYKPSHDVDSLKEGAQQLYIVNHGKDKVATKLAPSQTTGVAPGICMNGDSGGPLTTDAGTVIGVLSGDFPNPEVGKSCAYIRVDADSPYRSWITSVTGVS